MSKPNDWSRVVYGEAARAVERDLTDAKSLQLEFWTAFRTFTNAHAKRIRIPKPRAQGWLPISIGRSGFLLCAIASMRDSEEETYARQVLRAELLIRAERSHECFLHLQEQRELLDREMGEPLEWYGAEGVRQRSIYVRRTADLHDRSAWPEYFGWLTLKLDRLHEIFQPRVKALDLDSLGPT